jgi:blue copper oxidase
VTASDGGFLPAPVPVSQLTISPGERFEVLVDFTNGKAVTLETGPDVQLGYFGQLTDHLADNEHAPVMRFEPTAKPVAGTTLPTRLVDPAPAHAGEAVGRRQFVLDRGMTTAHVHGGEPTIEMTINGKAHDMTRIDAEVKLGTTEIWEVVSVGMRHPFHVHGASFRVLSLNGTSPPAHLQGWKDVLLVEERAELLVAFDRPARREYPFMFHCHVLEHEDAGMMGQYTCS